LLNGLDLLRFALEIAGRINQRDRVVGCHGRL
jgi:hypothetical protein